MLSVIGTRYAKALLDVAMAPQSKDDPKQVLNQLRSINEMIRASDQLHNALLSPAVSPARKRAVLARLMGPEGISKTVRNFLFVVIDHRRIHELPNIVEAFDTLLDARLGFVRADVTSAAVLADPQRSELEAELSRLAGKKARLTFTINPSLIGGVVARVGSRVYDGSVRGQLERLRVKLAGE
ncbi:MAG TPA: ATP synthase F1 subunit delta [Bryobacteraceae bacterium]|nr:ATP synthase F1 subunit delta [Bryobacteraceae bacterium]